MNKHGFLVATAALVAGVALATSGCEKDPDMNSRLVNGGMGGSTSTGSGGSSGNNDGGGGSSPSGIVGSPIATFDTTVEGFILDNYHDKAPKVNLGDPMSGLNVTPTIAWDGSDGNPMPGSLKVMAPYSDANQYVLAQRDYGTSNPQNWLGKTLHVRIKVTDGTFKGGAQVFVKTGTAFVFGGTYTNLAMTKNWQEVTLSLATAMSPMTHDPGFDPTQVIQFGVELNTGSAGTGSTPVTFNIDSFSVDPPFPPPADSGVDTRTTPTDSGSGGAPGGDAAIDLGLNID